MYLKEEKKLENLPNELNKKIIDLQGHQNEIKKKLNEIENSLLEVVESYKKAVAEEPAIISYGRKKVIYL